MLSARREALLHLAALLALSYMVGLVFGQPLISLLIGLGVYVTWMLWQAMRLLQWLRAGEGAEVPESSGLWGDIFSRLYQLQVHTQADKRQLASMLREFQASTAALPDGVIVVDHSDHISWCNEAAITLLGLSIPRDLGQRVNNLLRYPAFVNAYNRQQFDVDILIPSPLNANATLTLRIVAYGDGQKLVLARDVSHIEQMERSRRDFVANASHELRTPLTVIRGYLEMMKEESRDTKPLAPWREPLAEMHQQATRMGRIIEDLLKLARIEAQGATARHELVDVPQMLRLIIDEARALSKGRHTIEASIQDNLKLRGHAAELQSAFSNILFNAVQYTPQGGEIRLSWSGDTRGAHYCVTDTGQGIEARHIPRLTERFYRVDTGRSRASGGTGLGLAIVKHALEHHDSQLKIASQLNVGSTFSCDFPLSRAHID